MAIDPDFIFSANSLQDYLDCPRRFELKYMLKQAWPAVTSQPVLEFERHIQLGNQFHRLVQQYLNGIPESALKDTIEDSDLASWFDNFLTYFSTLKLEHLYPEFPLQISIDDFQVMAVYDLFATSKDNRLCIFDWKTSRKIPGKDTLSRRVQTILYPYAAFEATRNFLPGLEFTADQIQMTYLYAAHAAQNVITFDYSQKQYEQNRQFLNYTIRDIQVKESGSFECTQDKHRCAYCVYRSLCERGINAGSFTDIENEEDLEELIANLNFDAQDEIAF